MSFFSFTRDDDGAIQISDDELLNAFELMINQLLLLNARIEEAFNTGIELEDLEDE